MPTGLQRFHNSGQTHFAGGPLKRHLLEWGTGVICLARRAPHPDPTTKRGCPILRAAFARRGGKIESSHAQPLASPERGPEEAPAFMPGNPYPLRRRLPYSRESEEKPSGATTPKESAARPKGGWPTQASFA